MDAAALIVSILSVLIAGAALRHTRGHDRRIEELERQRHVYETGAVLSVTSSPKQWTAYSPAGPVHEVVAHVRNAGAAPSPPVSVYVWVNETKVGQSDAQVVPARSVSEFKIRLEGEQRAAPYGHDPIEIHVVDPDGVSVLAEWDGRY